MLNHLVWNTNSALAGAVVYLNHHFPCDVDAWSRRSFWRLYSDFSTCRHFFILIGIWKNHFPSKTSILIQFKIFHYTFIHQPTLFTLSLRPSFTSNEMSYLSLHGKRQLKYAFIASQKEIWNRELNQKYFIWKRVHFQKQYFYDTQKYGL